MHRARWQCRRERVGQGLGSAAEPEEDGRVGIGVGCQRRGPLRAEPGATDVEIGPKAVVGAGTTVGDGALIEASALHDNCFIGDGAVVRGSILAAGVVVEAGQHHLVARAQRPAQARA